MDNLLQPDNSLLSSGCVFRASSVTAREEDISEDPTPIKMLTPASLICTAPAGHTFLLLVLGVVPSFPPVDQSMVSSMGAQALSQMGWMPVTSPVLLAMDKYINTLKGLLTKANIPVPDLPTLKEIVALAEAPEIEVPN
jgi:hypothetical protein